MKALKTILTALLFVLTAIFAAAGIAACGNKNDEAGYKIVLDRAFPEGNVINYAEEIELPSAHVENAEGETVSYAITYRVTGENGFAEESEYSSFSLAPAKYTAVYVYSEKLKLEIEFTVIDSENPVIKFTNVPNDVFLGETDGGFLPTVEIEDASEVSTEKRLYFAPYGGESKEVSYNKMNDSYAVTEAGVFTFTVKAEDESGNSAENSVSWLVKDPQWTDESLEKGYRSDFGEEGYLNTVRSADVNVYWNAPEYSQEWLESYEGAGGVVKLGLPFTGWNFTAIRIRLSKPISWNELRGKYIAVRVFVEGEGLQDFFAFAGNQKIQFETEYSAATERKTPLITGKWTTYYLDYERAKALRMYSDENDDKDSPVSPIKELQFAFGRMNNRTKSVNLYIDGVSVAEKLPAPENLRTENGKLCWNAVQNAISYTVDLNGEISTVTDNFITLPDGKGYIKVSAHGDGFLNLDSEANVSAYGLYAKDGEYASFDDELYTRLIDGAVNVGSETEGYKPSFVNSAFDEGRIKITVGKGAWSVCTAVQVRFPQAVTVESGVSSLRFGMTASIGSECKTVMVFTSDYKYKLGELTVEEGKTEYVLDISGIGVKSLSGIQFVYVNKLAEGKTADMGENVLELALDFVAPVKSQKLSAPQNLKAENGYVSWSAVENAAGYIVNVNGEEYETTETSYPLPAGKCLVKVAAKGDGVNYKDSEFVTTGTGLVAENGEFASFNDEIYVYYIDDEINVGEETEGYIPRFMESVYENGRIKTTVGKGKWGVCTAFTIRFPEPADLSGVGYLAFGMTVKIGSESQKIRIYTPDYKVQLGEITIEDGKTSYVLDISGLNLEALDGVQFLYLNKQADGTNADMGENVLEFTFDYIAPATRLGKTEITADNAKRTIYWNAVENAVSYAVVKDGERIASVTGLSYDCSSLGAFDSLGVYAEGNGKFTDGEIAYAEITLSGDVWVTIKGIVSVKKVAYSTDGLLQLELNETTDFAENAKILTEGLNIILNGEKLTVTGALWTNVSTKINISCDLSATTAGAKLTVNAGTLFVSESGDTYKLSESYEAIFVAKSADGSIHWYENAGALKFDTTDYSATGVIQFLIPEGFNAEEQQTFDLSLMNVTANGAEFKFDEIRWHASAKKLALTFGQPAATADYPVPTIVIEKGSVIFAANKTYCFEESCTLVYGEVYGRWSLVHNVQVEKVSWSENADSVQLILTEDCKLVTGETLDTSAFVVTVNGKEVKDLRVVADSEKHIHLYGTFSTDSAEGYETPTLVIKAGSVAMLRFTAITFTEDVVLSWNGSAWVKA